MIRSLFWFVLAVSLLFNAFFAVGYVRAKRQAELAVSTEQIAPLVAQELELDPGQTQLFERLREGVSDDAARLDEALVVARQELFQELRRDPADPDRIASIMRRSDDLSQKRRRLMAAQFREFVGALSPEQRERLMSKIGHESDRSRRMRERMLREFDANGNGRLDPDEQEKATAEIERRRNRMQELRDEALKLFDENGDGELDGEESRKARAWMRDKRPDRHWDGHRGGSGRGRGGHGRGSGKGSGSGSPRGDGG